MTIQELTNNLESLKSVQPNVQTWVIKKDGVIIKLPNGKSFWRRKNHAGAALTNYVSHMFDWRKMSELRKNLGLENYDSLGQYLIKEGIVTIEQL